MRRAAAVKPPDSKAQRGSMSTIVKSRSEVTFVLLFFVVLAIVGIACGGFFVRDFARARASAGWPTADGVVLSQLNQNSDKVRYAYSFAGRSYQSTRARMFSARLLKQSERDYVPGDTIAVYVDPSDPAFSVLQPGGAAPAFVVFALLSGICIFFGVGGVIWTFSEGVEAQSLSGDDVDQA